jgi:hypothetical protein
MKFPGMFCVALLGLSCSAQVLAWDDIGSGWFAKRMPRQGNPDTAMIILKNEHYRFMAEYDCKNRVLLTYDLGYVGLPVPDNPAAAAMFDYACKK